MLGIILTVCALSNPSCSTMDWRTCLQQKVCQETFVPLFQDFGTDRKRAMTQCWRFGMMQVAQPGGWLDQNPGHLIKRARCGEEVNYSKNKEQEA